MDPQTEPQAHTEVPAAPDAAPDALYIGGGIGGAVVLALLAWFFLRGSGAAAPEETSSPGYAEAPTVTEPAPPSGLADRLRTALGRSRAALAGRFEGLFSRATVDEELFEELEMVLLGADVGVPTSERLMAPLRRLAEGGEEDPTVLHDALRQEVHALLSSTDPILGPPPEEGIWVVLVVGVNGSGKTTTIGKLAHRLREEGRSVLLAAGDTFRAAATEQLKIWSERAQVDFVGHTEGADPGAVIYDALSAAKARGHDTVIIDTAGRLQTKKPLMEQLAKVRRVIAKVVPEGPHETLLVIDGTMGQNALSQAKLFDEATPLTGVAITKLDGTAKGGMVLTIASEMRLPVKLIGIGEGMEDLKSFEADAFAQALI